MTPLFPFSRIVACFRHTLILRDAFGLRRRSRARCCPVIGAVERLEDRTLLSGTYPELVATVDTYDENTVQTNAVDVVAAGSSMTDVEFASRLAAAWANGSGGVIDGSGDAEGFEYGQDLDNALFVFPADNVGWLLGTPTDRQTISGTTAFSTTYSPYQNGYNGLTQYFSVMASNPNEQVLELGLTVLGQTLEDYGTVYFYGHLRFGGDVLLTHQVQSGGAEDVFFGLTAPSADYFVGFSVGYAPEGEWIVDQPLWFDDIGFITGDFLAGGNQAPTAVDDFYSLDEDTSLTVYSGYEFNGNGAMGNDFDPESHDITGILVSSPAHGTLNWKYDGGFTYTPDADFSGTDSFTYKIHDGFDYSNVATVTLNVAPASDPTVAQDDAFTLDEDDTLTVAGAGVLMNDTNPDGNVLTAALVSGPAHGTLTLNADGSFVYTPDVNFYGTDTFTYQALAGDEESNVATVTLNVERINTAPIAVADTYTFGENTTLTVSGTGVLANDSDQDGEPLTAVLITGPAHGTLTFNPDGSFSYTPLANFYGDVSFTYRASDGVVTSNWVWVTLHVVAANVAPVANDDSYTVGEDGSLVLPTGSVAELTMVSEPGDYIGQGLTYDLDDTTGTFTVERNYDNGVKVRYSGGTGDWWTLNFAAPGEMPLTPGVYNGAERFPFQNLNGPGLDVSGQGRGSNQLTGQFTVHEVVYGPNGEVLIFDASFEQHSEGNDPALTGHVRFVASDIGGLLINDADADGDPLSAVLVSGPNHGTLTLSPNGHFHYTPDPDFQGTDTFTYRSTDGTALSDAATVTITVLPANDTPVAISQAVATVEDVPYAGSVSATDVDGDALQYTVADGPAHGTLVLNADGSFLYTPDANFHGSDSFTFIADDGTTNSQPAAVTLTVSAVNDAPVASDSSVSTTEDAPYAGSVSAMDVDGDVLQYTVADGPAHGTLVLNADGSFLYTPDANFHGSDSFSYRAGDGTTESEMATVTLTVNAVNDAPALSAAAFVLAENSSVGTEVGIVTGSDEDGDALTYRIVGGNAAGAFTIDTVTGVIRVADAAPLDFETTSEFVLTVEVVDPSGLLATATVTVTLTDLDETLVLTIDVLPYDASNTISSKGHGRTDVAILSTSEFDVQSLDIESLRFGRTGSENSLSWKQGNPVYHYEDVNDDGLLDLIVQFERALMDFHAGNTEGYLSGQTLDGTSVTGTDDVHLTGNW